MMTLPFFCLMLRICPYGMDATLFWTHIAHLMGQFVYSTYHWEFDKIVNAIQVWLTFAFCSLSRTTICTLVLTGQP